MKKISDFIKESVGQPIDDNWLNNNKPVQTKDGRTAVVLDIDISKVPNIVVGQVNNDGVMCDYKWNDDGHCIEAKDAKGNPVRPSSDDDLVKAA